jgi:hypothetical protein
LIWSGNYFQLGVKAVIPVNCQSGANVGVIAQLHIIKARIESVIAHLRGFSPDAFASAAERRITQPRWNGKTLSGQEFLIQYPLRVRRIGQHTEFIRVAHLAKSPYAPRQREYVCRDSAALLK